jgi:glycosyltransferase involved in cell wall biosynthesis
MNIIHIPRRFVRKAWGGTETVVIELASRQLASGHQPTILTSMAMADSAQETMNDVPIRRFSHFYPFWGLSAADRDKMDRKGGNLVSFGLFGELLRMPDPGIFHLHTGKRLGALVRSAAAIRKVPYVVHLHGGLISAPASEREDLAQAGAKALEWGKLIGLVFGGRRVVDDADAVLCVDRFEADQLRGQLPGKIVEFVPNGVDPTRFTAAVSARRDFRSSHGIPDTAPLILTVGRIDPQKNQLLAVEILKRVQATLPTAMLAFAGPDTNVAYRQSVSQLVEHLGLSGSVLFLGQLDYAGGALAAAYAAADCFLLPSLHEPFGVVALEAWAANLPLAAAAVGGIPAFVHHDVNALLFASGDATAAAVAVLRLLTDHGHARHLAAAGRKAVDTSYSWGNIADRVADIYERASAHRRGSSSAHRRAAAYHPVPQPDHPATASDQVGTADDHPGTADDHPGTAGDHPGTADDHPGTADDHPRTVDQVGTADDQAAQAALPADKPDSTQRHPGG